MTAGGQVKEVREASWGGGVSKPSPKQMPPIYPTPHQEPTDQSPKQKKGLTFYYLLEIMGPFESHDLAEHSRYHKEHGGASAIRCQVTAKMDYLRELQGCLA